ncbi:MAG: methyltransferase domain-containing protein [Nakamurella sp.]
MTEDDVTSQVRAAYNTVAEQYAAHFPGTEPEAMLDLAVIDHFLTLLQGGTRDVLDAGSGTGRMSRYLTDRGCHVRGVDLSPGMVAVAHRDHPDITTEVASITALPFPDDSFDGLFYWYSVIHVPDENMQAVFDEARRALRPDGVVLVAFQAGEGATEVGAGYRRLGHDVTIMRFHRTADQVMRLLETAGFREAARMVRASIGGERTDQAVVIARLGAG